MVEGVDILGRLSELPDKWYNKILGMDSLTHFRANIDCENCSVHIKRREGKLVFQINKEK